MAIRVLATLPELARDLPVAIPGDSPTDRSAATATTSASSDLPVAIPGDSPTARGSRPPAAAAEPEAVSPGKAGAAGLRPAAAAPRRRPRRVRPGQSFPGASVAALALVAAAIWSLIAIREAKPPAAEAGAVRLAAEVAEVGAAETAIR